MLVSVIVNLGILCFFKYYTFIIENLQLIPLDFLQQIPTLADVELPIGISFYTFQTMSYTLDIYMGTAKVQKNIASFGAYVTLFPQLIAGPIVRYQDVDDQLRKRPHNIDMFASGMRTFVCGFAKKILLANCAGELWDAFRAGTATDATIAGAWLGIIFYSFQLYFDFSGYSDMAIGLGKMLGFTFKENFFYPYISKSVTEFWRRWHISMGTWFREYVYIPLGGSRCSKRRNIANIAIVWAITGLWHGAAWTFVLWGALHGLANVLNRIFKKTWEKLPALLCWLGTFLFVNLTWILFRAESLQDAGIFYGKLFAPWEWRISHALSEQFALLEFTYIVEHVSLLRNMLGQYPWIYMGIVLSLAMVLALVPRNLHEKKFVPRVGNGLASIVLLVWSIMSLSGLSAFLYFNF